MQNSKAFQFVIEKLISAIESAVKSGEKLPWQRPWLSAGAFRNMSTGWAFTGPVNLMMLHYWGEGSVKFATFSAIKKAGATLKGAAGKGIPLLLPIIAPVILDGKPALNSKGKPVTRLCGYKYYTVYADKYISGGKFPVHRDDLTEETKLDFEPVEEAERVIALHEDLRLSFEGNQACYIPAIDKIRMPVKESFKSVEAYYCTLFHELGHWTRKRVNQDKADMETAKYSFEELCAEFTACIAATATGIDLSKGELDNSAAYLQSWLSALKSNPAWLSMAAGLAEKRAAYILDPAAYKAKQSPA